MSKLTIQQVSSKSDWERFIQSRSDANFLQSWNWGKFHEALGKKVFRFGLFDGKKQIGCALIVKEEAKRATYLTISGGPILDWEDTDHFTSMYRYIKNLAKKERACFVRLRPQEKDIPKKREMLTTLGFRLAPMHLTADLTIQLDLTKSLDQLLIEMRKNTRYEIRKSQKLGITVKSSNDLTDIRQFYSYQLALSKKHGFVPFSYEFLLKQFDAFVKDDQVLLFHAYSGSNLLASAYVIFYNNEAVYHYGISTPENDHLPGSYACQWAAIQAAKRRGMTRYNLWGVAPKEEKDHRFAGVSIFKRGFGGGEVQHIPTHDLPMTRAYKLNYIFEMGRKKLRRL